MKNRILVIVAILIVIALLFWLIPARKPETVELPKVKQRKEIYNFDTKVCPGPVVKVKMADPYMRGLIDEGSDVSVKMNWFACNPIERNQVVLYRFSEMDDPVIRRVVGQPKDKFEMKFVKGTGWYLKVNGKNVNGVNGSYYFGGDVPPPLKLAADAKKGVLGEHDAIVFSSFGPGFADSGMFGVVSVKDIVGLVDGIEFKSEIKENKKKTEKGE